MSLAFSAPVTEHHTFIRPFLHFSFYAFFGQSKELNNIILRQIIVIVVFFLLNSYVDHFNTRAKRLRMPKVSIFKLVVANANFTTIMPVFELKSTFISIQNFKAGNVKPPGMHWSKDF